MKLFYMSAPMNLAKIKFKANTRAKQAKISKKQNYRNRIKSRVSGYESSVRCRAFRVSPVMTTSIPLQMCIFNISHTKFSVGNLYGKCYKLVLNCWLLYSIKFRYVPISSANFL